MMKSALKGPWLLLIAAIVSFQWRKSTVDSFWIDFDEGADIRAIKYEIEYREEPCKCSSITALLKKLLYEMDATKQRIIYEIRGQLVENMKETEISIAKLTQDLEDVKGNMSTEKTGQLVNEEQETMQSTAKLAKDLDFVKDQISAAISGQLEKQAQETMQSTAKLAKDLDFVKDQISAAISGQLEKQAQETMQSIAELAKDSEYFKVKAIEQATSLQEIQKSINDFSYGKELKNIEISVKNAVTSIRNVSESLRRNDERLQIFDERLQSATIETTCNPILDLSVPSDCSDIRMMGSKESGVYQVSISDGHQIDVFCDFDTPGGDWLVFQRRKDGSVDFFRNWKNYTLGFGDVSGEFWLGNEILHQLTSRRNYKIRIDLEDFENQTRFAEYSTFSVGPASDLYRLDIEGYSGNAGNGLAMHDNQGFSTYDVDLREDELGRCAKVYHGAWWYNDCLHSNLNGLYLRGIHDSYADGIEWYQWHGYKYSLKTTEMKISRLN